MTSTDVIIDFNGYYQSVDKFIIKEYSLLIIDKKNKSTTTESQVTKPRSRWLFTNFFTRKSYRDYFLTYGIKWNRGDQKISDARKKIIEQLTNIDNICVRDQKQKELLLNFIDGNEETYKIICCDELGYDRAIVLSTVCRNHEEPLKNNCASDNVIRMYEWLKKTRSLRKPKKILKIDHVNKHVVVDFIGYYIPINQFVIKEFNAFVIDNVEKAFDNKHNKYFITEKPHYVTKKPIELKDLPFDYQVFYSNFYDTFGIDWGTGSFDFRTYLYNLRKYFSQSVNIYVRNNENKRLLLDIIGREHGKKVIVLRKFGYNAQPKMKTKCLYHNEGWRNNCAIDNSESMVYWIIENRGKLNITDLRLENK